MPACGCVLVTESNSEGRKHDLESHRVHKIQTERKISKHKKDDSVVAALTIQTRVWSQT